MPRGTHRIEVVSFHLIRFFVRRLSIKAARWLGAVGGQLSYYGFLGRRRCALRNLELAFPGLSRSQRHALARKSFRRSGSTLLEATVWSTRDARAEPERFEVVGSEHMEGLLASDKGFIVMGAHFGVWEVGLSPYEEEIAPVTVIAKRTTNPLMQAEADAWRERRGFVQVLSSGAAVKIFKTLKRGDRAGFIADQRVQPEDGILVPFFGEPAWTSPMMAAMSLRTGVPVLPHFAEPLGEDRYRIRYLEPIDPVEFLARPVPGEEPAPATSRASARAKDVERLTRHYTEILEENIRERPELWFWVHARWRRIKRYRWDATKARWLKRSGLSPEQDAVPSRLPKSLNKMVKRYRKGPDLQAGTCLVVEGGDLDQRRRAGVDFGHAVIAAGRSYRWLTAADAAAQPASPAAGPADDDPPEAFDLFDAVAILVGDGELSPERQRWLETLVTHRVRRRRSVALLSQQSWLSASLGAAKTRTVHL